MSVRKTGDWTKARKLLAAGPLKLKAAIGVALRQEAQLLRKEIVQGITNQAPGGRSLEQLSELTLEARQMKGLGGTKALLVLGDLRNSVTVVIKDHQAFIGILRKARDKDGNPLIDVAQVHEFGAGPIVIPMTPAMRRFLFALLNRAGNPRTQGTGRGVVVVTIPARPFLRPAFEKFSKGAQKRFLRRVAKQLKMGGQ